jgi:site-specific DNA-methyltransferase (adenine-specific)
MMTNDLVLIELNTARTALAKADTIQKTKNVLDVAVAAETYAKRQKLGEEAVNFATSIKVEALRQLGNMLKDTPRNTGVKMTGKDIGGTKWEPPINIPTLEEMGLDKKTSKLAQDIASLPEDQFEKVRKGVASLHEAQKSVQATRRYEQRIEIAELGKNVKPSDRWAIQWNDIEHAEYKKQFDFIITDPPYPKEFLPLYETLAIRANDWLKDGGLLVAMCGQSYLNEIYAMMSKHLTYYWTAAYLTPGQPTPLRQVNVNTTWKPLLIFRKGEYKGKIFGDVFVSDGNDKSMHKWGQSESGMYSIISKMCLEGQSILDPFCGAGTTGIAALKHGCFFDGIEKEQENVEISHGRLYDATK